MRSFFSWPWVETQATLAADLWRNCAHLPLPPAPRFTSREQRRCENAYEKAICAAEHELHDSPRTQFERLARQKRLAGVFPPFAAMALGLENDAIHLIADRFLPLGVEFARSARRFDPELTMSAIIQACRNAWTVCGLQPLLNERMQLTPSIIGYSLLYPYTDNYLDRNDLPPESKRLFCRRFRQRLRGECLAAHNEHEAAIWALVAMIEAQYPRAGNPQVFDSLLAIHQAQEESIAQLDRPSSREFEVLRISFAKGGSSVLADACLVRGSLNPIESQIAFGWGALLQLGDDLQDVQEDLRRGSATLFTRAVVSGKSLDSLVMLLLNFSRRIGDDLDGFPGGSTSLKNLLRTSWRSIIVSAAANIPEYFSSEFLAELECSSPFRFAFLRQRRERLAGDCGLYEKAFNAYVHDSCDGDPPPGIPQLASPLVQLPERDFACHS